MSSRDNALTLESRAMDALPLINYFLQRLGVDSLFDEHLGPCDGRCRLAPAKALGVLLRNILSARAPLYSQQDWAGGIAQHLLGLSGEEVGLLNDDRVGRALDSLFAADRATLLTRLVLGAVRVYDVDLTQLHNDSTTVTFSGNYAQANGRTVKGKRGLTICHGHNKDHRPDLKQLLYVLTISADGAVPIHFQTLDGNAADVDTHLATWEALCSLSGRPDFLYVADSKLCAKNTLQTIDSRRGRFITIMPSNRRESAFFHNWLQENAPSWQAIARPSPRQSNHPADIYQAVESPIPSAEGFRIVWIFSSLKLQRDREARQGKIEKANHALGQFAARLRGPRCRYQSRDKVDQEVQNILTELDAHRWVRYSISEHNEPVYRQERRGRPGTKTRYERRLRRRFELNTEANLPNIEYDARCDGIFPLITNCRDLSMADVLEAYKYQPNLEKRHEQFKSVYDVAPVWLKNEARIEALLFVYFVVMLVQSLIERQLRQAMETNGILSLPLYPEERECRAPSANVIFHTFQGIQQHRLHRAGILVRTFPPSLSLIQSQILDLLKIPTSAYITQKS
jgi:transposase